MKLLLHACCAPCAIYPGEIARTDNFEVTGFFYNPNIHPYQEFARREKEARAYFRSKKLALIVPEYDAAEFFNNIEETEPPARCASCWKMRLDKTVSFAKEKGFNAFTTTLLGSPYQDEAVLEDICSALAKDKKVSFYYKDFKAGFCDAHKKAHEKGMYCQNYCGCIYSKIEREEQRTHKKRLGVSKG